MRVLLAGCVPREGRTSMIRFVNTLYTHLCKQAEEDDLFLLDQPGGSQTGKGLDYHSLSVKLEKRLLMPLRLRLTPRDILHIIDNDYLPAAPQRRLNATVVTTHDMMPFLIADDLRQVFRKPVGLHFYQLGLARMAEAACVVCDSEFTRECVLRHTACRPERLRVIPLGVDACFKPLDPGTERCTGFAARHNLQGRRVLLHVGTTEPYKNVETVLAVLRELLDQGLHDVVLLKIGGVFSEAQRELIARKGLSDHIVHARGLSEDDLVDAYCLADVLLWPSRFEGFGLPVLEAMACGTPVVCSDGGSLREFAPGAAAVHACSDVAGLAASCRRVIEDDAFAETLRENGLERAAHFTWPATATAYIDVYRSVWQSISG